MSAFFIFKRAVGMAAQPLAMVWLLALLALASWAFGRRRAATFFLVAGMALTLLCSFPPLVRRAAARLESGHAVLYPVEGGAAPVAVVVLGSGVLHPDDPHLPALTRLGDPARARLAEGVRLARLFPNAALATCGYGMGLENCADVMADAAVELGVDPARLVRLATPMDTAQEAEAALATFGPGADVVVVTSAAHMPRALGLFREAGLTARAAPCDFIAPVSAEVLSTINSQRWLPKGEALTAHEEVWHEALGLIYTRYLRGRGE